MLLSVKWQENKLTDVFLNNSMFVLSLQIKLKYSVTLKQCNINEVYLL